MTAVEIIQSALARDLVDEDGERITLDLLPGLSDAEIDALATELPCAVPASVRELLRFCRGFYGVVEHVDFTGRDLDSSFGHQDAFPHGLPIAADGFGNFWVVDLHPASTAWSPIYFCCHDAPVFLYQSDTLERFLTELFKMGEPPHRSEVDDVHEDRIANVWGTNPGVMSREACLDSPDPTLAQFAGELDEGFEIIDLRNARVGEGFSWGRYGADTEVRRFGSVPLFAYRRRERRGLLSRLFGH